MNSSTVNDWMMIQGLVITGAIVLTNCIGIAAAIIFWRRSPKAASLCLGSMLLTLICMVGETLGLFLLARTQPVADMIFSSGLLRSVTTLLRSIAIGMLITSTFIDRRQNHAE
jgi:hypothetical protein